MSAITDPNLYLLRCPSCDRRFVWQVSKYKIQCANGHIYSVKEATLRQGAGKFMDFDRKEEFSF